MRNCFSDNKGGATWLKDVVDLLDAEQLHWTFDPYRDREFAGPVDNPDVKRILAKERF